MDDMVKRLRLPSPPTVGRTGMGNSIARQIAREAVAASGPTDWYCYDCSEVTLRFVRCKVCGQTEGEQVRKQRKKRRAALQEDNKNA